ncbi:uncharacterized protein MELLADRAFT_112263 [Melampsora larici-populina 98AG31]|uniref:Uncharacterized protein n=1 Tax=Melampsora larici-populina (strain 98AG31 / pathotype 3-4-7) TaxID=747676 RepID=F4S5X2_MELLP|nr:uncharacterized protein MELLADRAFT_112263 [Melampsora larici-populina 98AG31]EGF99976.1 hypothetical protein MELLADRAFT_112263 [Melampsora larici-populina 98AG31]
MNGQGSSGGGQQQEEEVEPEKEGGGNGTGAGEGAGGRPGPSGETGEQAIEGQVQNQTPRDRWWSQIETALSEENNELAKEMLQGFVFMYGKDSTLMRSLEGFDQPGEQPSGNEKRGRSPERERRERPRTESLIVGDDEEDEIDELQDLEEGIVEVNREEVRERGRPAAKKMTGKKRKVTLEREETLEEIEEGDEEEGE